MADKKEYIERGALLKKIFPYGNIVDQRCYSINAKAVQKEIQDAPTADVAEVVYGEWTLIGYGNGRPLRWKCSACGYETLDAVNGDTNFCPNCGAKMDGERKEHT